MCSIDAQQEDDLPLPRPLPKKEIHTGSYVMLEPLSTDHTEDLWNVSQGADSSFSYLKYGPFPRKMLLGQQIEELSKREHQPFWAVRDLETGHAQGWLSLCDIYENDGAIEIGSVWFSPSLQRSRRSTEAVFLLMRYAMDILGYQRLVWRCCFQNAASRRAALRYGFVPEGIWRKAAMVKGTAMDIAWYSLLRTEWGEKRAAIAAWLKEDNFTEDGVAITRLLRQTDL